MNLYNWHSSSALATLIALIIISPIVAIFYSAFLGDTSLWPHLFSTVLPRYVSNTIVLMIGVGILSIIFGVSSAWVVTRYNFFGKKFFEWALLLPAAVPAYIIAYTYTDFLEYAGPFQKFLRETFNWNSANDYWLLCSDNDRGDITVTKFKYYMDGVENGELHLLSEPRMCLWISKKTNLQTPYHGYWYCTKDGFLDCYFDYRGRWSTGKWARVIPDGTGYDYWDRTIKVVFKERWLLDPLSRTFLLGYDPRSHRL